MWERTFQKKYWLKLVFIILAILLPEDGEFFFSEDKVKLGSFFMKKMEKENRLQKNERDFKQKENNISKMVKKWGKEEK